MWENLLEPLNHFNMQRISHDVLNWSQANLGCCPPHRGPSTPLQVRRIDGALCHSKPCLLCQTRSHPKMLWCLGPQPEFFPRTKRSKLKLKSGTFSPHLIPSLTMNCQLLFQPRPPRNQILLYFTLKPCPSNWSHFIRPLLSHGTCSIPSRGLPIGLPIQMRPTSLAQG